MVGEEPGPGELGQLALLAQTLEVVSERASLLILQHLWVRGPRRVRQLRRSVPVGRRILSDRLDALEGVGVVARQGYPPQYGLSASGQELVPTLVCLMAWGERHLAGYLLATLPRPDGGDGDPGT